MNRFLMMFSALVLLAGGHHVSSTAAEPAKGAATVSEIAMYQGADRHDRLVAAAQKEGELSVYHAYPNLTVVMAAFTKKYGIKVNAWRAGSEAVLQRIVTEARGLRFEVDIVQNNAPENEALHREKLVQEVRSPYLNDLMPQASPAHREWVGITLDVWIAAYNTNKIKKEDTIISASFFCSTNSFYKIFCFFRLVTVPDKHILREPQISPEYRKGKHKFTQIV